MRRRRVLARIAATVVAPVAAERSTISNRSDRASLANHGAARTTGQLRPPPTRSTRARVMAAERLVIVGAGPAGFSTARAYRDAGGSGAVTLVGAEPRLPYERPPLTKAFLRGEMDAAELTIEPQGWFDEHEVELCLGRWTRA